ncbi:MAG: serine/threonine protein kinase, partial [Proteobacteria bacterium]|nr:serine/threonine protein kinase [Pseudomonadota bacterium]
MRWLTAVYAAELTLLGLEAPKDFRTLVTRKLQTPSLGDWSRAVKALGTTLAEVEPCRLVAPELVAPFRGTAEDPLNLGDILKGFVETRNNRISHRKGIQIPPEAEAAAILKEQSGAFQHFCWVLGSASTRPLLVVSKFWRKRGKDHAHVVRFAGRDPVRIRDIQSSEPLPMEHQVPFLVGDQGRVLVLHPWVVAQQATSTGTLQAMLWYCWDDSQPRLLYTDTTGLNECCPFAGLDAAGPDSLPELAGCAGPPHPSMLLSLDNRVEGCIPSDIRALLLDSHPPPAESLPEIHGYELESTLLGRGAAGSVYVGRQSDANRGEHRVAIKIMHDQMVDDPEFRERFEREGQILQKLQHASIISVLEYGQDPVPYIVMEIVEGGDLASLHTIQGFSTSLVASIGVGVLGALAHAHAKGIVHRDIKPSNILLSKNEQPVLVDWGIASATAFRDHRLTRSHEALGTIRFSAPEQLERGHLGANAQADIYSVGRVLEYLSTGDTAQPDDVAPGMPPGLEAIVRRATHRNPDLRFRQATEMIAALLEREQVGWLEGGPVQAGDRVGDSYDLVEARGEIYEGCFAFRALEVETDRQLRVLLARRNSSAAKVLVQAAREVKNSPTTLRFGSLICCTEDEDVEDGVVDRMAKQGLELRKAVMLAKGIDADSFVSSLAVMNTATAVSGGLTATALGFFLAGPTGLVVAG